jgi:tyrosyl-tRNA synthetase
MNLLLGVTKANAEGKSSNGCTTSSSLSEPLDVHPVNVNNHNEQSQVNKEEIKIKKAPEEPKKGKPKDKSDSLPYSDIIDYLKRLSFATPEKIMEIEKQMQEHPEERAGQKLLAAELTELVHGKEGLEKALRITETFFRGNIMDLPAEEIKEALADAKKTQVEDGVLLIDALVAAEICKSKGEARKLIQQGSVSVNGEKKTALDTVLLKKDAVSEEFTILKKGKKNYFILTF